MTSEWLAAAAVAFAATAGSVATASRDEKWYACVRPPWTPPDAVFPVAWMIAYTLLAIALSDSLRNPGASLFFQLANLTLGVWWCEAFFGHHQVAHAGVIMLVLIECTIGAVITAPTVRSRGCLVAYLVWALFAWTLSLGALVRRGQCL